MGADEGDAARDALGLTQSAIELYEEGHAERALAALDDALIRVVSANGDVSPPALVEALSWKGYVLLELGRDSEAHAVFDDVISRTRDASDPLVAEHAAVAYVNQAECLLHLGRGTKQFGSMAN